MRIATWNVNSLRARLEFVKLWLADRRPDVVGLQELKLTDEQFPHQEFEALGYHSVSHGQKSWNGVAVLSREPAEVLWRGLPGGEAFGSRLITTQVSGLHFTTVYVPNGKTLEHGDFPRKLDWLDKLAAHLAEHPTGVLCGDFNICPGGLDSYAEDLLQGRIFHTEEERRRFRELTELGLKDLFRELNPDRQVFSWWDYRGGAFHRKQGLRIDLILGDAAVAARTREVWVDRDYRKKKDGMTASDHAPVIAELD